jgi:DNA-binding PadR family transcriptional regulator
VPPPICGEPVIDGAPDTESLASQIPLSPQDFHVLFALAEGDRHGYRLVKEIEQQTGGLIRIEAGNLYRCIRRLIKRGLICESDVRPGPESDDERRRYYRITDLGEQVLAADIARMRAVIQAADARGTNRTTMPS